MANIIYGVLKGTVTAASLSSLHSQNMTYANVRSFAVPITCASGPFAAEVDRRKATGYSVVSEDTELRP